MVVGPLGVERQVVQDARGDEAGHRGNDTPNEGKGKLTPTPGPSPAPDHTAQGRGAYNPYFSANLSASHDLNRVNFGLDSAFSKARRRMFSIVADRLSRSAGKSLSAWL